MPEPYPDTLRKRVLQAFDEGAKIGDLTRIFNVSRRSVYRWIDDIRPLKNFR